MVRRFAEYPLVGRERDDAARRVRSFAVHTHVIYHRPDDNGIAIA
jgi:hypothetical protein